MKTRIFLILLAIGILLEGGCASISESGERYRQSLQDLRDERIYFAVANLQTLVKEHPQSPYAPTSMFALGEYYFDHTDYYNAIKMLSDFVQDHPNDKGVVFAKVLIYKIITEIKKDSSLDVSEDALIKEIRKQLFSQPLLLIFYDKKSPRSYKSLFGNSYAVYDYVDKIKVFRNDKIFIELSP